MSPAGAARKFATDLRRALKKEIRARKERKAAAAKKAREDAAAAKAAVAATKATRAPRRSREEVANTKKADNLRRLLKMEIKMRKTFGTRWNDMKHAQRLHARAFVSLVVLPAQ
jgi:hypothetical protein